MDFGPLGSFPEQWGASGMWKSDMFMNYISWYKMLERHKIFIQPADVKVVVGFNGNYKRVSFLH